VLALLLKKFFIHDVEKYIKGCELKNNVYEMMVTNEEERKKSIEHWECVDILFRTLRNLFVQKGNKCLVDDLKE